MKIICLTPIKNEEWILGNFLSCVSLWADNIIIADQNSTDNSVEIALHFQKVILIRNTNDNFNEPERQKLLIEEARKIEGEKLLIALDADEFLSGNFISSMEFAGLKKCKPGTKILFEWLNIHPNCKEYWSKGFHYLGFIDDNSKHIGIEIDSPRLPINSVCDENKVYKINEIKVLHLQYTNVERLKYKQIWYQCLEKTFTSLSPLGGKRTNFYIFQRYNKFKFAEPILFPLETLWLDYYYKQGINVFQNNSLNIPHILYIKELFDKYSVSYFSKLDIWDINWNHIFNSNKYNDPRDYLTKLIHKWLNNRKYLIFTKSEMRLIKVIEKFNLF
jgi:hypothetical protein